LLLNTAGTAKLKKIRQSIEKDRRSFMSLLCGWLIADQGARLRISASDLQTLRFPEFQFERGSLAEAKRKPWGSKEEGLGKQRGRLGEAC
jgi:hypothetical protein